MAGPAESPAKPARPTSSIVGTPPPRTTQGEPRPSRMARRRAVVLVLVHVVVAVHIAHWLTTGRSASPVEPSEAHRLLQDGVLNTGAILLGLTVLSTLLLGRWFCGWACHVVALQDACAWLLGKIGIRPRPVRARVLMWVPALAALDVFVLPRVFDALAGVPSPSFRTELTTDSLWATFPGPWMTAATLLVDGFLIVYLLGAKGFCTYGCPYGAIYGFADRFSKARIRVNDACEGCGHCTATCTSNVDVRAEVARYGMVVDSGCMKCMDCVTVCPKSALSFGFTPASEKIAAKARGKKTRPTRRWDFTWPEEIAMGLVFLFSLYAFRGLYDAVPFLLAIGLAVIVAFTAVMWARVAFRRDVELHGRALKRDGRLRPPGLALLAIAPAFFGLTIHSGAVRIERRLGERAFARADVLSRDAHTFASAEYEDAVATELSHFENAGDWGLVDTFELEHKLGTASIALADRRGQAGREDERARLLARGEQHLRRALELQPDAVFPRVRLAKLMVADGRLGDATDVLARALAIRPTLHEAADVAYGIVGIAPEMPGPRLLVVDYLTTTGDFENARNALAPLLEHIPDAPQVVARVQALDRAEAEAAR